MTRRCSHCSSNGHNSRTCPGRAAGGGVPGGGTVKLFGVRLTDGSIMKKSASMGNLSLAHYHSSSSAAASPNPSSPSSDPLQEPVRVPDGYLSDDLALASSSANRRSERKKGTPWTEDEHRLFLLGLQKLGKGDWRGISRNFVISRTPTQVASHAQKYFIRQSNATRRKRRSSLFDMVPDMAADPPPLPEEQYMLPPQAVETGRDEYDHPPIEPIKNDEVDSLPSLDLSLKPDFEPMETSSPEVVEEPKEIKTSDITPEVTPQFFPALFSIPFPIWPSNVVPIDEDDKGAETSHHQVLKPIPVIPKEPVNVDELVGMSELSLGEKVAAGHKGPSPLSLKLLGEPSRLSAFQVHTPANTSDLNKGSSDDASRTLD